MTIKPFFLKITVEDKTSLLFFSFLHYLPIINKLEYNKSKFKIIPSVIITYHFSSSIVQSPFILKTKACLLTR